MKRTPPSRRIKWTQDTEELTRLASGLALSGSRVEDTFWEARLAETCVRLLGAGREEPIVSALDKLHGSNFPAYEALADMVEAHTECTLLETTQGAFDVLMIIIPVLAWSRFSIYAGNLGEDLLAALRAQLSGHVLATDTRLALADCLFSPDQLPYGYAETHALAKPLWAAALAQRNHHIDSQQLPQTPPFVSDIRYVVGAVAAPRGKALFRWQEEYGLRDEAVSQWSSQGGACLHAILPGCVAEVQLPGAYFSTCRLADIAARAFALRAAVDFLHTVLDTEPAKLRAAIAPFHEQRLEEYRVGFSLNDSSEVCHGVVWPLLGIEDENTDAVGEIETALRQAGVSDITVLEHSYPREYCDDCGAALFPNPDGEVLHVEMPEEEATAPQHLH